MGLKPEDLKVFQLVAGHRSVTGAAAELQMAQQSVSDRIRVLERVVGEPLFMRSPRGMELTAAGLRLLPYAGRCLSILDEALAAARSATRGESTNMLVHQAWTDALTTIVEKGRKLHKEVVLHTHFNHPNEITSITERAMNLLCERGIVVRNQSVLQRGVNDTIETMRLLVKRLGHVNVHPYYVYVHDLVKGVEDLRTSLDTALTIEKHVRGSTAGFNTPTFVVDAPGGGGKRNAHSYEHYDRETGISVFTSPAVKADAYYLYFDPLHQLSPEVQKRWQSPVEQEAMIGAALEAAKRQRRS